MNVNGVTFMTVRRNQILHGPTAHQLLVMITTRVQSKICVKMASVWASNTPVKLRIHSPVVYRVQSVMVMEHVELSRKSTGQYVAQLLTNVMRQKGMEGAWYKPYVDYSLYTVCFVYIWHLKAKKVGEY